MSLLFKPRFPLHRVPLGLDAEPPNQVRDDADSSDASYDTTCDRAGTGTAAHSDGARTGLWLCCCGQVGSAVVRCTFTVVPAFDLT